MHFAVMTTEVMEKMAKCFESVEDIKEFSDALCHLGQEFVFLDKLISNLPQDSEPAIRMKSIAMLTLFVRENIECIRDLIKVCDLKPVSEEQVKELSKRVRKKIEAFDEELDDFDTEL